jgi:hypothetical protein
MREEGPCTGLFEVLPTRLGHIDQVPMMGEVIEMADSGHGMSTLYRTPRDAMNAPTERLAYVALLDPDAIAVVDVDRSSPTYGTVVGQWDAPSTTTTFGGTCRTGCWWRASGLRRG